MGVAPRSFNQINAFACTGTVVKSSENIEAIEAEKNWYRQLPEPLQFIHPRIYDLESPGSIRMEYLDYPTAHEMYIANRTGVLVWTNIFQTTKAISYVLSQDSIPISKEESDRMIDAMYIGKTEKRLEELIKIEAFKPFFRNEIVINGKKYISIYDMIETIKRVAKRTITPIRKAPIIHGDLHLANMLVFWRGQGVKLIDPRGDFAGHVLHGDGRYDTAKLMHSIEGGYDLMIENAYKIRYDLKDRSIRYKFNNRASNKNAEYAFSMVYEEEIGKDRKALTTIEALLFLSMIPLHPESLNRQLVMLARGYELMEKALGSEAVRI